MNLNGNFVLTCLYVQLIIQLINWPQCHFSNGQLLGPTAQIRRKLKLEPLQTCGRLPALEKSGLIKKRPTPYKPEVKGKEMDFLSLAGDIPLMPVAMNGMSGGRSKLRPATQTGKQNQNQKRSKSGGKNLSKTPHVTGGREAVPGHFPSYVKLAFSTDGLYNDFNACGGILVGPRTVITAGHCLVDMDDFGLKVIVGLNSPQQANQRVHKVQKICLAREYCVLEFNKNNSIPINDLAILELSTRVTYNDYVQPACVPLALKEYFKSTSEEAFDSCGMGRTETVRDSPVLMWTRLHKNCGPDVWSNYDTLKPSVECYLGAGGTQTCNGDSGGPIYYYRYVGRDTRQFVGGAVSFGPQTCKVGDTNDNYYADIAGLRWALEDVMGQCTTNLTKNEGDRLCTKEQWSRFYYKDDSFNNFLSL